MGAIRLLLLEKGDDKTVFEKLELTKSKAENDQEKFEVSWEWIFS